MLYVRSHARSDDMRHASGMRMALVAMLLVGCGEAPRCLLWRNTVEVYGGTAECVDVEAHFASAVKELRTVIPMQVPAGSITFLPGEAVFTDGGETVNGKTTCFPFAMTLGTRPWGESRLAHELAHWGTAMETGDWECNFHDGAEGHAGWEERGIYEAIRRWRAQN